MPVSALDGQVQEEQREGYDVATIHYTDGEGNERAIPLTRWDGAVDLSWYNGTDTEFTITTARQLAGVAALVNSNAADFAGKTIRLGADISLLRYEETGKPGGTSRPTQPEKPTTPDTPPPATAAM